MTTSTERRSPIREQLWTKRRPRMTSTSHLGSGCRSTSNGRMSCTSLVASEQCLKRIEAPQRIEFRVRVDILVVLIVEDQRPALKPRRTQQVNGSGPVSKCRLDPGPSVG